MTLSRAGFHLLGDEWAPITDDLEVEPSNVAFRLQGEWAATLGVDDGELAGGKKRVELTLEAPSPKPIQRVLLLETGSRSVSVEAAPAAEAFSRLMESCFRPDPERRELLDAQIELVTRLVNEVPIAILRYPHRIESTVEVVDRLRRLVEDR